MTLISSIFPSGNGDDIVDRLNYCFTTLLLIVCAIFLGVKQLDKPINCWVPAQFTDAWEKYTNDHCWSATSYFLPTEKSSLPTALQPPPTRIIAYYQWMPMFICLQTIMFLLPYIFWRIASKQTDVVSSMTGMGSTISSSGDVANSDKVISKLVVMFKANLSGKLRSGKCVASVLYLTTKSLYVVNLILQLVMFRYLLGLKYTGVLVDLIAGREVEDSAIFPRTTICDYKVTVLSNTHHHSVQCSITFNMLCDKFFLFIWCWLILVLLVTLGNLIIWICNIFQRQKRSNFVHKYISADKRFVSPFIDNWLGADGLLALQLIADNSGDFVVAEVLTQLWSNYEQGDNPHISERAVVAQSELTQRLLPTAPIKPTYTTVMQ